jgi:hypothetical protein
VRRYRVRYLPEATKALRSAFVYILEDAGPGRAGDGLTEVYASVDQLERPLVRPVTRVFSTAVHSAPSG